MQLSKFNENEMKINELKYFIPIIIAAIVIIFGEYTIWSTFDFVKIFNKIIYVLSVALLIYFYYKKTNISKLKLSIFFCLYISYLFLIILVHPETIKVVIFRYVIVFFFIFLYLLYCEFKEIDVLSLMAEIIYRYSLFALLLYVIFAVLKVISPVNVWVADFNNNYNSYLSIFYISQTIVSGSFTFVRNGSVFCEPGAYSLFLLYSLLINIFYHEKINTRKIILLFISILSTVSTTGIILAIFFISIKLIKHKFDTKIKNSIKITFIPFLTLGMITMVNKVYSDKINGYGVGSYTVRHDDLTSGFNLFKQKFLFGWGIDNIAILSNIQSATDRFNQIGNNSNGIISVLYQGGIHLAILYCIALISLFIYFWKKKKKRLFAVMIIIYLITELYSYPFQNSMFMFLFMAIGYYRLVHK